MNHTKKDLRIFSLVLSFILALISIKSSSSINVLIGGIFLTASVLSLMIGIIQPVLITPIYKIGKLLISIIMNLLFSIVFYCVFTPISVILKTVKKDILGLSIDKGRSSYWIERKERVIKPESLEKQF